MTNTTPVAPAARRAEPLPGADPEIELLIPEQDAEDPELSIVIPALNEEITISTFVQWCHEGLAAAGVRGEIVIVDSSTDSTPDLALEGGARVLRVPKRGLGRAYMDAIPYVRGTWVLMGDADCTYDFRRLAPFVERFRAGDEFVMGSRWAGTIEAGAMPKLHQYFGTPFTTWILNRLYSSKFTDIHCGMRGMTTEVLQRMNLSSPSWEYASEIVLKSVHMGLRTSEVPVTFLKDMEGRESHHRREGWWSPFHAAWINLRAMFVYGSDFFTFKPGIFLLVLGLLLELPLLGGPITVGPITFSLYWMLLGTTLTVLGLTGMMMGAVAQVLLDRTGRARPRWTARLAYTRTVSIAAGLVGIGVTLTVPLVVQYVQDDFQLLLANASTNHLAVGGLTFVLAGALVFGFTLLIHAAALTKAEAESGGGRPWTRA